VKPRDTEAETDPSDTAIPGKRAPKKGKRKAGRKSTSPAAADGHLKPRVTGTSRVFAPKIHPDAMGRRFPGVK